MSASASLRPDQLAALEVILDTVEADGEAPVSPAAHALLRQVVTPVTLRPNQMTALAALLDALEESWGSPPAPGTDRHVLRQAVTAWRRQHLRVVS